MALFMSIVSFSSNKLPNKNCDNQKKKEPLKCHLNPCIFSNVIQHLSLLYENWIFNFIDKEIFILELYVGRFDLTSLDKNTKSILEIWL